VNTLHLRKTQIVNHFPLCFSLIMQIIGSQ